MLESCLVPNSFVWGLSLKEMSKIKSYILDILAINHIHMFKDEAEAFSSDELAIWLNDIFATYVKEFCGKSAL